ncbi:PREDICTED: acyl-CoA dehydrogenase family member 11, partial [Hipposideros armiger]|uniref:Acyl-CoA dehydrogenase family member 11 n=1 Tax=Hipposideros armiger TaxID=186990 RepID=A0A8B7QGX5_HIPAR
LTISLLLSRSGQSNPTFYLQKGFQQYVLRKKPPGPLLPKAHKIDREFKVQKALFSIGFPVPKPLLYCSNASVIGTEFYVMEHVQGRIFRDFTIPGVSPAERSAIYVAMIETLAQLHSLNIHSLQLEGYGIGSGYCKRQSRVIAVLDWELSTIGHPLSDLAHLCMFYFWPRAVPLISQGSFFQEDIGIPSMEELISVYCRCRGITPILPNWNFFLALSFFKMAAIVQGVYSRYLLGNNVSENSFQFANVVQPLAETGLQLSKSRYSKERPELAEEATQPCSFIHKHERAVKENMQHRREVSQEMAKAEGLWNLFLPAVSGLNQVDYALIAEETGKCFFAPDVFNCQAPDTGNMELLHLYGNEKQKQQWLEPLLQGSIASCFCMTEPDVASSDATNIECSIQRDGDSYVINGKKWWSSGAGNPKCKIAVVLGRTRNTSASRHKQHSMILVPISTPGVEVVRPLSVFGYMDHLHGGHFEIHFNQVRVPATNLILGEGRGFEIAQGRLGPGRIHHCMRVVGLAERALQIMCKRAAQRVAFKKKLYSHEVVAHWIAESRIAIEEIRLLTLRAAHKIDTLGSAGAKKEIAMIKVAAPRAACKIIDQAIQVCGGAGLSQDYPLAYMYALTRSLRLADGPDEVHLSAIAKLELKDQARSLMAKM